MKNEINNISKKKSFLWEFLKEYILHLIAALVLLYFTVAGIIGNFLSKEDNMAERVFEGVMIGFLVAFGIVMVLGIVILVYCNISCTSCQHFLATFLKNLVALSAVLMRFFLYT